MNRSLKRAMYANALTPALEEEVIAELATGEPDAVLALDVSLILRDQKLAQLAFCLAQSWRVQ